MSNKVEPGATGPAKNVRVETPTVLQMESVECGAACLAIILAYYGRWTPLEELRVTCGVTRDGAKASNIVKAARQYGLDAKGMRLNLEQILEMEPPVTVFWNFNHFVVVEGRKGDTVYLNDPASGPRRVSFDEFDRNYTGIALVMRPGENFQKGGERRKLISALSERLKGSGEAIFFIFAISLMLVFQAILLPAFIKTFIDDVLIRGFNEWLLPIIIGLIIAGSAATYMVYLQQKYLLRVQVKLGITSASQFFWHVLRVPVVFYTQRYVGDVAAREQSCQRIAELFAGPLSTNLANGTMIIFLAMAMAFYSVTLTAIVMGLALLNVLAVRLAQRKLKDLNTHLLNQQSKVQGASMVGLQAIETLKATGTESDFFRLWSGYQTHTVNTQQHLWLVASYLTAVPGALVFINNGLVLGVGGWLIIQGQLTIGGLLAFQLLSGYFNGPIKQLVDFTTNLQEIHGDLTRLDDVLRYRVDEAFKTDPSASLANSAKRLSGSVEMKSISFAYSPLESLLLKDFNLKLDPGMRVAFVGTTGSGKSTLAKLLLGLYKPTSGDILYDGKPISQIPRAAVTQSIAHVDQELFLFEGTIEENLTLWDSTVSYDDVIQAARDACIHETIAARPNGYNSLVNEGGTNFSGGQAQRLEIARALVRNPNILILDEATAALDSYTEQTIDDNLRRRGCTCIIIAHRLSTIRDCDEIVVLDRGKISERGNHDRLMANNGLYAQLVASQ